MTEKVETTFQKVFRVIVEQKAITIPETGINPETPLLDIFGSTRQPLWAGFLFFGELQQLFKKEEYLFSNSIDFDPNNALKTVGDLVKALDTSLMFSRERRVWSSTFNRVRMNFLRTRGTKDLDPNSVKPESTLKKLGLGVIDFFEALVEDFQTDHPDFELDVDDWMEIDTIQQVVDRVDKKLDKVPTGK